jgi:hypothetical protein
VKWSADTAVLVPPEVVTRRSTVPAVSAGEVAVQVVVVEQLTEVPATVPNLAVVEPTTKFVPVMVTTVPATNGPAVGEMPVTVGGLDAKAGLSDNMAIPVAIASPNATALVVVTLPQRRLDADSRLGAVALEQMSAGDGAPLLRLGPLRAPASGMCLISFPRV